VTEHCGTNGRLGIEAQFVCLNHRGNMYILHRFYKCTIFVRKRKRILIKNRTPLRIITKAILVSGAYMTKYNAKLGGKGGKVMDIANG
jgi:hypothetical protein